MGVGVGWVEMKEMKIQRALGMYLGDILGRVIFVFSKFSAPTIAFLAF